ncbi:MAG: sporulation protein [Bacteroidota bacterium]
MFGKVKKWLGIEGAKMELIVPEEVYEANESVTGKVRFFSMTEQKVRTIKIVIIEKYTRGRRKNKLTDEYQLGEIQLDQPFLIPANETVEIDFSLPFKIVKSEMDELGDKNIFAAGLAKTAKWINGVNSSYRIEAEADVEGVGLNPFTKREISIV